jgi:hypothetical protein
VYQECSRCGRHTVTWFDHWGEESLCAKCSNEAAEAAGDLYISQLIDLRRGK